MAAMKVIETPGLDFVWVEPRPFPNGLETRYERRQGANFSDYGPKRLAGWACHSLGVLGVPLAAIHWDLPSPSQVGLRVKMKHSVLDSVVADAQVQGQVALRPKTRSSREFRELSGG